MIKAKDFSNRQKLEKFIFSTNPNDTIQGTREELENLQLSDRTTVYGLKCVITDTPTQEKFQIERPQRGKIYDFGVNYQNNKKPT